MPQVQIYLPYNGRDDSGASTAEMAAATEAVERMTRPPGEITRITRRIVWPDVSKLTDEELARRIAEGERERARHGYVCK